MQMWIYEPMDHLCYDLILLIGLVSPKLALDNLFRVVRVARTP